MHPRRNHRRLAAGSVLALVLSGLPAAGRELQVPAVYSTIQGAIQAAREGDTVLVSPGTYRERLVISGKSLILKSQRGPAVTVLDGADKGPVITLLGAGSSRIQGFTVLQGAWAPGGVGGGILVADCSPLLTGNIFRQNRAAAVWITGRGSEAILENGFFADNELGVSVEGEAAATIKACRFEMNATSVRIQGPSRASVIDCRLSAVPSAAFPDIRTGLEAGGESDVRVVQSIFQGLDTGVELRGPFQLEIINCLFFEVFTAVRATKAGELLRIRNTIFASCFEDLAVAGGGSRKPELITNLSYPWVPPFAEVWPPRRPGEDPLFVDARGGDFRLGAGSPALDAGTVSGDLPELDLAGQPRISGAGIDIGPFEGASGPGTSLDPVTISVPGDAPTIQEGIARAMRGDEVLVAPGTYRENLDFLGKSISVVSSGGRASTTLLPASGEEPAVKVELRQGGLAKFSGFTILGGEGFQTGVLGRGDVELRDLEVRGFSAGIESSGRIVDCVSGDNGIGVNPICCSRILLTEVLDCLIEENETGIDISSSGIWRIRGNTVRGNRSGLRVVTSITHLERNLFESNLSGVLLVADRGGTIRFNTFRRNQGVQGGALRIGTSDAVELEGNVFEGNTASGSGGAISISSPYVTLRNNLFASNSAPSGGALEVAFADVPGITTLMVVGNTFTGNTALHGGGVHVTGLTDPLSVLLIGNVFWGNRTPSGVSDLTGLGPESVFACDIEEPGFADRNGNISADPRFADPARGDFHLLADSPCIDRGAPPPGSPGEDVEDSFRRLDFERDSRVLDGDGDGVSVPDMGCDELDPGPGVRVGDCNDSGSVDISDAVEILAVLYQGAGAPPCREACDADRSSSVNVLDAVGLLASLFGIPFAVSLPDLDRCRSVYGVRSCVSSTCP